MPLSTIKKTMIHAIDKARINCQTIEPVSSIEADFLRMTFLEKKFSFKNINIRHHIDKNQFGYTASSLDLEKKFSKNQSD